MRWLKLWLPAILWAVVISGFSTGLFTSEHTSLIILPFLRWLLPHATEATLATIHMFIRKSGHFFEYFILSLLILRGIRAGRRDARLGWAVVAIALVAGYASLDEFHQSFVPGRTAAVADVLLDTAGGIAAQAVAALFLLWGDVRKRQRVSAAKPAEADAAHPD
ncbi:MAG: VanZ family protein [Candidatus Acidiferrales bacterium]